ncbi:uncharacterized protein L969DRAFT_52918 [Mixia osmundae IAM 14324]|uniref:Uncharacterized protein n=1 Tax=Mixia osmundae (strain CBS 9802 / IAM 14324 / JCM 22182 / KY 12970) TaxID=764103 RepID=G7DS57_MIXOS|nr:uncharacterized protein L969DRAFT_52918 [Mixia osmundae IAM 14324]KEI37529.1 hypothetical protein L969DRAFT_52918 [Mixia osmundae IAM 14324]GAA93417.1 hypothetical protein E5Q_00058 [Mixia osmundae IAM 14324]
MSGSPSSKKLSAPKTGPADQTLAYNAVNPEIQALIRQKSMEGRYNVNRGYQSASLLETTRYANRSLQASQSAPVLSFAQGHQPSNGTRGLSRRDVNILPPAERSAHAIWQSEASIRADVVLNTSKAAELRPYWQIKSIEEERDARLAAQPQDASDETGTDGFDLSEIDNFEAVPLSSEALPAHALKRTRQAESNDLPWSDEAMDVVKDAQMPPRPMRSLGKRALRPTQSMPASVFDSHSAEPWAAQDFSRYARDHHF